MAMLVITRRLSIWSFANRRGTSARAPVGPDHHGISVTEADPKDVILALEKHGNMAKWKPAAA